MARLSNLVAVLFLVTLMAVGAARGAVVYDNGTPEAFGPAYRMTESIQAEDFVLSDPAVVTGLRFYGLERSNPNTGSNGYAGSITWAIRRDDSGQPGATNVAGATTSAVERAPTDVIRGDYFGAVETIYAIDVAPVALDAGHYWLVLHNGPLDYTRADNANSFLQWAGSPGPRGEFGVQDPAPFEGAWESSIGERSFSLIGVPEPTASFLWCAGAALVSRRRRRTSAPRNRAFTLPESV
jgi:hypothetical protein